MKTSTLFSTALFALGLVVATTGCSTFFKSPAAAHVTTYALVVSVNTGQPPTDAQWAELQKRFATALGARGYALVSDPAFADRIIHVRFSPDETDPTTGTAYVVSIKTNTLAYATSGVSTTSAGFGYDLGLYNDYSDASAYYTPTHAIYHPGTRPPPNSGTPNHPAKPDDGPPGTTHKDHTDHPDHPPITFVGNYPTHIAPSPSPSPGDGHRSHPRSDSGYSRSDSNYSRSDSSSSSSNSSSPSLGSSYSTSSDTSSSFSSPSSSYSAPSSSSSSYSPPTESASGHDIAPK